MEHEKIAKETLIKYNSLMGGNFKTDEERKNISQNYIKYCMKGEPGSIKKQIQKTFHNKVYKGTDTASDFMKDYIEATYNMFQIQQKRIDELEIKLEQKNK